MLYKLQPILNCGFVVNIAKMGRQEYIQVVVYRQGGGLLALKGACHGKPTPFVEG